MRIKEELLSLVHGAPREELPRLMGMLEEARAEALVRLIRFEPLPPDPGGQTQAGAMTQASRETPAPRPRHLRTEELLTMLGVARSTLWKWRRAGLFPEPVTLGPNVIAWPVEAIDRWRTSLGPAGTRCGNV